MKGARAHLHVVRLQDGTTLVRPILLECEDQTLESARRSGFGHRWLAEGNEAREYSEPGRTVWSGRAPAPDSISSVNQLTDLAERSPSGEVICTILVHTDWGLH